MWPIYKKVITRQDNKPYLIRFSFAPLRFLLGDNNWFQRHLAIKIHHIILDDNACQHDHPWNFSSVILKGGYFEWQPCKFMDGSLYNDQEIFPKAYMIRQECKYSDIKWNNAGYWEWKKWHGAGSVISHKAKDQHKLELAPGIECWTFVITGRVVRKWGFHTNNGWVFWRNYSYRENC